MPDREAIVAAIETYCRVQTEKDRTGWEALFSDDVFHEDSAGFGGGQIGRDHIAGPFWDHIVRNNVAIWLTDAIIVSGNEALAILACDVGAADARRRMAPVVDHFIFAEDGKIASVRGFYNLPGA